MQLVYRDITQVVNHKINITLPDYFDTEKVEIIIIPLQNTTETKPKIDYNNFFGVSDLGTTLIDKYLENFRNEWDRTIFD